MRLIYGIFAIYEFFILKGKNIMGFIELILLAVALAMDAFAVSMCKGLSMKKINYRYAAVIALYFGVFQAVMPVIGYFLGVKFEKYITSVDHWIAFALLVFIGGKMVYEAVLSKEENEEEACEGRINHKELLILAVATSIDALAVGITFAFLRVEVAPAVLLIGAVTFIISFVGVLIGNRFGEKYKKGAEVFGGVVLILLGVKILLEHLGILNL